MNNNRHWDKINRRTTCRQQVQQWNCWRLAKYCSSRVSHLAANKALGKLYEEVKVKPTSSRHVRRIDRRNVYLTEVKQIFYYFHWQIATNQWAIEDLWRVRKRPNVRWNVKEQFGVARKVLVPPCTSITSVISTSRASCCQFNLHCLRWLNQQRRRLQQLQTWFTLFRFQRNYANLMARWTAAAALHTTNKYHFVAISSLLAE